MFYLVRNLKTTLLFSPHDMHQLGVQQKIIERLKDKIQGRCHSEYGYIIQQSFDGLYGQDKDGKTRHYKIYVPEVVQNGCRVTILFSAICFKAQKNDIVDFKVTQIMEDYIKGKLGPAEVLIPKSKMDGMCEYKKDENIFVIRTNQDLRIDKGSKVRCKCFQIKVTMNFEMKILATLPSNLLKFIEN